jgi:hypothetical protein
MPWPVANSPVHSTISELCTALDSLLQDSESLVKLSKLDDLSKARQFYIPSEEEREEATLASVEEEVDTADKEIEAAEEAFRKLSLALRRSIARKQEILKAASNAQSLVAPVRILPPDILLEIFALVCDEVVFMGPLPCATKIPGLRLAAVCSLWRSLVISSGRMWSNITVTLRTDMTLDLSEHQVEALRWVLDMSNDAMLTIKVTLHHLTSSAVLPIFRTHSRRWKSFTLYALPQVMFDHFGVGGTRGQCLDAFPELQYLSLVTRINPDLVVEPLPSMALNFTEAPNLRSGILIKTWSGMEGLTFDVPWSQLRHLYLCPSNGSEVFNALARCKALLFLELMTASRRFDIPPHPHSITSNLTKLIFHVKWNSREYDAMKAFLDSVTLTSLQTLEIKDIQYPYLQVPSPDIGWPVEAFRSLIQRSRCALRRLLIVRVPMSDTTLISILECVSDTLEELTVREPPKQSFPDGENEPLYGLSSITDRLVERLAGWHLDDKSSSDSVSVGSPGPLLPALHRLDLSCKGKPSEFNLAKFLKMVQLRCPPEPRHGGGVGIDSNALTAVSADSAVRTLPAPSTLALKTVLLHISMQPSEEVEGVNQKLESDDMSFKLPAGVDIKIVQQPDP